VDSFDSHEFTPNWIRDLAGDVAAMAPRAHTIAIERECSVTKTNIEGDL
jgi:hypothetical protein